MLPPLTSYQFKSKHGLLFPLFFFFSLLYLLSLSFQPYPLQYVVKVIPISILLFVASRTLNGTEQKLLMAALFFSGIGDVTLSLPVEGTFIFGLAAFLVAHILYIVLFAKHQATEEISIKQKVIILLIVLHAILAGAYLLPFTDDLMIPVIIYMAAICLMAILAVRSRLNNWVVIGAISFVASDTILANGIFRDPIPASGYWVMLTYYFAQYAIVNGLLISFGDGDRLR